MKKYWSDLCIAVSVIVLAIAVLNLASKQQKQYNDMAQRLDEVASHTDALDTVMVDINYKLNDIQDVQKENQEENQKTFNKLWNSIHKNKEELQEEIKRVEESKAEKKIQQQTTYVATASYDSGYDHDFKSQGTVNDGTYNYTWYSQRVLPGGGLDIPGRHVDEDGFIRDEDGNLCIAARDIEKGTEVDTPYGKAIVYDYCPNGNLDIYTDW